MANLATGCFRKCARLQERNGVELDAVNLSDGSTNPVYEFGDRTCALILPFAQ